MEDLFFEVTEGIEKDAVSEKNEENAEAKESENAGSEGEDAK